MNKWMMQLPLSISLLTGIVSCRKTGSLEEAYDVKAVNGGSGSARFEKLIKGIEKTLNDTIGEKGTKDEMDTMTNSDLRNVLFKLENLAEIYEARYPKISTIKVASKRLEDNIGAFREVSEKLEFAKQKNASPEKIRELESRLDREGDELVQFLESEGWNPASPKGLLKSFNSIIRGVKWDSGVEDRLFLYSSMCEVLTAIHDKPWDMSQHLDDALGLHTLKKEVRWHRVEVSVFDGDIISKSQKCDNDDIFGNFDKSLEAEGKLADICKRDNSLSEVKNLVNGSNCQLSSCYLSQIDGLYSTISTIKDEAEQLAEIGQTISRDRLNSAQTAIDKLKKDIILRKIAYEFKSCMNKSK